MPEEFSFKQECDEILRQRKVTSLTSQGLWDDYLSHGVGNNLVSGEHEDRDVLELMQNARDAIAKVNDPKGQILIAVTSKGMVIANTGAPFNLDDKKVFDAVTLLGESSKTEETQMIGHKGIGMKSILQRFGKFSIHTHLDNGDELTAIFSRARTYAELRREIENSPIKDYIWSRLPKLPLFRTPHPDICNGDELFDSVRQGLLGQFDLDEYTTSLSLYYRDIEWEDILKEVEKNLTEKDAKNKFRELKKGYQTANGEGKPQDRLWELLTDHNKLDPRTFILLGHISEIQMINFQRLSDGGLVPCEIKTYHITGTLTSKVLPKQSVHLKESSQNNGEFSETERAFLAFSARYFDVAGEYVRLLFEKPGEKPDFNNQPIYLYYPIQTAKSGLPFLIHGPFLVTPSRKELSNNETAQKRNKKVVESALDLLKTSLPALLAEPDYCDWMPWMVLPLKNENAMPILGGLGEGVIGLLKDFACVPGVTSGLLFKPGEMYFIPERPNAFMLFETDANADNRPFMAKPNRERYKQSFEDAAKQIGFGNFSLDSLIEKLTVPINNLEAEPAIDFFVAICYLLNKADAKDSEVAKKIGEKQIPIFPVPIGTKYRLVEAMPRNKGTSEEDSNQNLRIVFRIKTEKTETPPRPPQGIDVYFVNPVDFTNDADLVRGALENYSQEWDISEYQGYPDLFKRVSERLDELINENGNHEILPTLGYLAGLLYKINPPEKDVLFPRPYSAINIALLESYLDKDDKTDALQELTRMQNWRNQVSLPVIRDAEYRVVKDTVFGLEWASLLENYPKVNTPTVSETENLVKWGEAIRVLDTYRKEVDDGCVEIAGPENPVWEDAYAFISQMHLSIDVTNQQLALFKLLLLLGVRIGPRVEWRWLSKSGKGQDAMEKVISTSAFHNQSDARFPSSIGSDLVKKYTRLIRSFYQPSDEYIHFVGIGHHRNPDLDNCSMYAWIWFKDLESGNSTAPKLFTDCLEPIWKDIERLFVTGWFFEDGSRWAPAPEKRIPSLAKFQLFTIPLWDVEKPEKMDGYSELFPLFTFLPEDEKQGIDSKFFPISNDKVRSISFTGTPKAETIDALFKLNWLLRGLSESYIGDDKRLWKIHAIEGNVQTICYKLLKKINNGKITPISLKMLGFAFPAVKNGQWYAVPLSDEEFSSQLCFFDHSPFPWEREKMKDWLLIMTNQGALDEELRSWVNFLGAKLIRVSVPDFDGEIDESNAAKQANSEIISILKDRKMLLGGVLQSILKTDIDEKKNAITQIIDNRKVKAVKKKDEMKWAYQDKEGNLIYFLDDFISRGAAVIAFGLAQQLVIPGSVADITLALSANEDVIRWELKRQGIEIARRSELVQEKLHFILDLFLDTVNETLILTEDDLAVYDKSCAIDAESGLGAFYDYLKPVFQINAVDSLLKLGLEQGGNQTIGLDFIKRILEILRGNGWNTDQCKHIFDRQLDWSPFEKELDDQFDSLKQLVALAQIIAWIDVNYAEPDQDDEIEYVKKAKSLGKFHLKLSDTPEIFGVNYIFENLKDRLLVEQGTYDTCVQCIGAYLDEQRNTHPNWPPNILECLERKSLYPLIQQSENENPPELIDRGKRLDEQFYRSKQIFESDVSSSISQSIVTVSQKINDKPNGGIGNTKEIPKVTLRQGIRGRIAELYVLEVCWQNFLNLNDNNSKQEVLTSLKIYYETNEQIRNYRWDVFKNFDQRRQFIIDICDKESFCKLLDLTGLGFAGFDILVPYRLWPVRAPGPTKSDIYCVEVKAVFTETPQIKEAEIILTTHEYLVAKQNQNYTHLLRLIAVPPGVENSADADYSTVRFIRDIDLITVENMKSISIESVRGGHFPLRLSWE